MPIFVFNIQLAFSKWLLSVGLFYISRLIKKVNIDKELINFVVFQWYNTILK